jgi:hypothetical protein
VCARALASQHRRRARTEKTQHRAPRTQANSKHARPRRHAPCTARRAGLRTRGRHPEQGRRVCERVRWQVASSRARTEKTQHRAPRTQANSKHARPRRQAPCTARRVAPRTRGRHPEQGRRGVCARALASQHRRRARTEKTQHRAPRTQANSKHARPRRHAPCTARRAGPRHAGAILSRGERDVRACSPIAARARKTPQQRAPASRAGQHQASRTTAPCTVDSASRCTATMRAPSRRGRGAKGCEHGNP